MAELDHRLPASEVELWKAWQHIEPWGWRGADLQSAKIMRSNWMVQRGSEGMPEFSKFLTPARDFREFTDDGREEMEMERSINLMRSILR